MRAWRIAARISRARIYNRVLCDHKLLGMRRFRKLIVNFCFVYIGSLRCAFFCLLSGEGVTYSRVVWFRTHRSDIYCEATSLYLKTVSY